MRSYAMHLSARKPSPFSRGGTIADTAVTSFAIHTHTGAFPWIRTPTTILVARRCDLASTVSSNTANGRKLGSHERAVSTSSMLRRQIHRSKGRQIEVLTRRPWLPACRATGTGVPSDRKICAMTILTRHRPFQITSRRLTGPGNCCRLTILRFRSAPWFHAFTTYPSRRTSRTTAFKRRRLAWLECAHT